MFVKIVFCRLGEDDLIGAEREFEDFIKIDSNWGKFGEGYLCGQVFDAIHNQDDQKISTASNEFESSNGLERWMIPILLKIKKKLSGDEEEDLT